MSKFYLLYRIACLFVHLVFCVHASSACSYGCCRVVGMPLRIPSWQGRVSGKITRAFNLHLQLGESTWCCQTFDFMISPTSLQLGVYFEKDKSFGKNTVRINLRVPNFQKFPGGACPQTLLAIACFACWLCFAQYIEATITHPHSLA